MINIRLFFYAALLFLLLLFFLYSFAFFRKKKYLSIQKWSLHQQVLTIVYISLLSATSAAILIVINNFVPIVMFPPVRISFEGILVKVSGFLFGPIVGLISALVTELVVISFVPSYFHYKYLILLLSFGFFSGLVKEFKNFAKNSFFQIAIIFFGLIIFFYSTVLFLSTTETFRLTLNASEIWTGIQNNFHGSITRYLAFFVGLLGLFLLFGFIFYLLIVLLKHKRHSQNFQTHKLKGVIPILILTVYSEYFISACIATEANRSVFGENSNDIAQILFSGALAVAPFKIIINTVIILAVWRSMHSFIEKNNLSSNAFF